MAYEFYKLKKVDGKLVLKKFSEEYQEIDAINKFNNLFEKEIKSKIKTKSIQEIIDKFILEYAIKDKMFDFNLVPEWMEYVIVDEFDIDSPKIQKIIKDSIDKNCFKEKRRYYSNFRFVK